MGEQNAVLLANHGMNCVGPNLQTAFAIAKLYVRAKAIGNPVILPDEEMDRMVVRFANYGQKL